MGRKFMVTNIYLLQGDRDEKGRGFGYIQGFAYLPDYSTKVKIHINSDKFESASEVDGTQVFTLDRVELASINQASQFVDNSLKTLISLARSNLLKEEFFNEE